jgi:hypothetical protein
MELDATTYEAVVRAAETRWTHSDELLYQLCMLVDRLTVVTGGGFGGAAGVRATGNRFEYRRPIDAAKPEKVSLRDFARRLM